MNIFTWNSGEYHISVIAASLDQAQRIAANAYGWGAWWIENHPPRIRDVETVGIIVEHTQQIPRFQLPKRDDEE